jgi:hypothetical protein
LPELPRIIKIISNIAIVKWQEISFRRSLRYASAGLTGRGVGATVNPIGVGGEPVSDTAVNGHPTFPPVGQLKIPPLEMVISV